MRRSRILLLTTALLALALAPAAAGNRAVFAARDTVTYDVPAEALTRVVVENPVGRVTIVGQRDASAVVVEAERTIEALASGIETAAGERLSEFRVHVERTDDVARVSVIVPPDPSDRFRAIAHLQLTLPRALDVVVTTADEPVRLLGVQGASEVRSIAGDVVARRVASLDVASRSGDIDVRQVSGDLVLRSERGDVQLTLAEAGSVEIVADDGDVRLQLRDDALDAAIHATTRVGTVESEIDLMELARFERTDLDTRVSVRTDRGHIRISTMGRPLGAPVSKSSVTKTSSPLRPMGRDDR